MSGAIRVLLPPTAAHLAERVLAAGCTPVIDATGEAVPSVPEGAWVRTRPGRPAPGVGPVVLAELGAPVPDRPTWLETGAPRDVPAGFAGLVLKGREAGGLCGEEDGFVALARCSDPGRVLLDAGLGPRGAAAARALGAGGVLLVEPHLGCPELALPPGLARRLSLPDDEVTRLVHGLRVCASATAPVLRRLTLGEHDPWTLASRIWQAGDPAEHLWLMGQGLALAGGLADRYGTLPALLAAYREAWEGYAEAVRQAEPGHAVRAVGTAAALAEADTAATVGGTVGAGVLWEEASWLGRPIHGGPLEAAAAIGAQVVCDPEALGALQRSLPAPTPTPAPAPTLAPAASAEAAEPPRGAAPSTPAIAIVGIGCRFPGGSTGPEAYWQNIVAQRYAIGEVPKDRWDAELFYDPDPAVPDKTYCRIGGFLTDFVFDPKAFRIPPNVARQVDPVQQITLMCVADALRDAGLKVDKRSDGREFDRERCAVILGNSLGGEMSDRYAIRLAWPDVAQKLVAVPPFCNLSADERLAFLAQMELAYKAGLPVVDEDSMPGELANVIAGRIANAFDLGGANFTVDAACASSMAAIDAAVKSLRDGESDVVITGGADRSMNIATYVKFCKIGALSPDHSAPFDASANGFVMGEGCGILVLKRYEDAVRDKDRVYAVIRGIGASSDGRGKGITAPNLNGQLRALRRAYEAAGIDPTDVDLVEAHGTSTVVGDKVEVEALTQVIGAGNRGDRGPVRVGSVKSMIGHLKSAAGAASVIKAALALHHGVLPPSINFRQARPEVPLDAVPLKVQTVAEPWPEAPDGLRRAGVSAFGFGGTNFHVVLESFAGRRLPSSVATSPPARQPRHPGPPERRVVVEAAEPVPAPATLGLPEGLWAASGRTRAELLANLEALRSGSPAAFHPSAPLRIAAAPADAAERDAQLDRAIGSVRKDGNPDLLRARGIAYEDAPFDQKLVFVFTGQGSQYLGMGLDLADTWPVVAETFAEADRVLTEPLGRPITDFIRLAAGEDAAAKEDLLRQTEYSQPATLTIDVALLRLLASYGVLPDIVAGHSLGEYGAAVAAGVMTFEQSLLAVSARGREMASIRIDDPGKMAGIATSTKVVDEVLADVDGYVIAANKNCPTQTVIAGASDAVDEACERFKAKGITVYQLPVSHAFHSRIVAPASEPLRGVLARLGLQPPRRPTTTNVTGEYYPRGEGAVDGIIDLLAQQISAPVEWVAQMERMYEDAGRVFVEVGPKRALSGFTVSILKRRPHRSIYTNHPKRGGVASLRDALAQLLALGVPVRSAPLHPAEVDLFATTEPRRATTQAQTAYTELHPRPSDSGPHPGQTEPAPDLQAGVVRIVARTTGYDPEELDLDHELEADLGIDTVKQAEVFSVVRETYGIAADPSFRFSEHRTLRSLIEWASSRTGARRLATEPSAPAAAAAAAPERAVANGVDAEVIATFLTQAAQAGLQGVDAEAFARALLPAVQALISATYQAAAAMRPAPAPPARALAPAAAAAAPPAATSAAHRTPGGPAPAYRTAGAPYAADPTAPVVCSGTAIGLPGGDEVFGADNFVAMLTGRNRIDHIGDRADKFLDLGLVRLIKDPRTGQGSFLPVQRTDEVIRLAGIESRFDLREWDIDQDLIGALDVSTRLAFAAGLEALRDAGIPLVRSYRTTASGKRVPQGWQLPKALRDGTGVIFGSAFPGYDMFARHLANGGRDAEGRFDRRFLFQVLAMGHSQFAQLIGARGPNTSVNAACASSTQALSIAEDWIRCGRCERVVVIGADNVTSESLLPWIGGGFMAAGAATTHDVVEEAALPFDRRRHGLILGMGAVAVVVETEAACRARGVVPIATQLAALTVNSAFHGTRLDVDHIAGVLKQMVDDVCAAEGITPEQMARDAFFMSHETYTPARGGSAAAEIEALRAAFGPSAREIVVTNTKGYTGHPMGAGIEDGVVLKALQYGVVPPVANLAEPDEQLGDLTLSSGERRRFRYAIRLAAGFGSQLALTLVRAEAVDDERLADRDVRIRWLREVTGYAHVAERIEHRTLRAVEADADQPYDLRPDLSAAAYGSGAPDAASERAPAADAAARAARATLPEAAPRQAAPAAAQTGEVPSFESVLTDLVAVVAAKTGYDPGEIEPDFELEADLGVDTVKQAEILGDLTDRYGLEQDDQFRVADYPTLTALAGYLMGRVGGAGSAMVPGTAAAAPAREHSPQIDPGLSSGGPGSSEPPPGTSPTHVPLAPRAYAPVSGDEALQDLLQVVAAKTGYEPDELEPDFELEADLGIDTVKQAEILGELTERYGLEQDDTFRLSDHPTLRALSDYLAQRRAGDERDDDTDREVERTDSGALSPEAPTPRDAPPRAVSRPSPTPSGGPSLEDTLADLVTVVAEKTGYEVSDLEPSFELEADLGVDTVKQAEILGELQERFDLPRDGDFRPADHPTLEALARYLHGARTTTAARPIAADAEDLSQVGVDPRPRAALSDLPFVAEEFDLSIGMSTEERVRANHVPLPPSFRVRRPVLERRGAVRPEDLEVRVLVLGDTALATALRHEVSLRGGVDQGPYHVVIDAADDLMTTFRRARALEDQRPSRWITVTRLGGMGEGAFGIERGFVDGGRAGFTKSLGREWGLDATVLDVHPGFEDGDAARAVCDEIGVADADREVFVDAEGTRWAVRLEQVTLPDPTALIGRPVVLLTGGGRGITARVAMELARSGAGAVALVGRSPVSDHPLDEPAAKQQIRAQLQLAGERVTPARVEAALSGLRRTEEVRQTLESLRELGLNVRYFQADLADPDQAVGVVDAVLDEFGTLDLVVHGAGVEESRQLKDKDETGFHRVFDGKAVGGRALIERLPESTFLVCMGSVAGRFGNPGQVDYAAANDALARLCQTRPNSLQVDWTAWDDVGMAVRGGMRNLLTDRGVELLPADAGAALLVSLVAGHVTGEVVVAGKLGDFESGPTHPLLDTIEVGDGKARGIRAMSRATDPWVADHAIEGVPVLPGVVGLECMAATASTLMPDRVYRGARNVRFAAPMKIHREAPTTLVVEAQIVSVAEVRTSLVSERKLATGRIQRTEHFEATLLFDDPSTGWMIEGLPSVFLPDEEVEQEAIYRRFFHGPAFQVLTSIFGVSSDGLVGEGRVDEGPLGGERLLTRPLVLEAAFQAAGLHRMLVTHTMGLPFELEEVQLYRQAESSGGATQADAPLSITVELEGNRYNVDVDAVDGPVLRMRGFSMVEKGPVPPHDRFPEPDGGRPVCFPAGLRHTVVRGTTIAEASADEDPGPWLSDEERSELETRGTDKRIADRIAGRIAAKRALSELTGVDPMAIRIWTGGSGQPVARVPGHPAVRVSISHREGRAVAVAVTTGRVGVDLERVEVRPESFGRTWFREDERDLVGDPEKETIAWAVKEAVLKWLGTGLRASPHDVRVVEINEGTARVLLTGASAELHARLGGDALEVTWSTAGADEVIVTVRSAA
jgi:acyl transferase domain-containing protein/NAD(P)-dependent dehydrogenase (short-subunit alcohol dehydrogenase family)/phosphopantetheinyl transferase